MSELNRAYAKGVAAGALAGALGMFLAGLMFAFHYGHLLQSFTRG